MKQLKYCSVGKIELKEDEKDFHVKGLVATSHPDRAKEGKFEGDILPKSTLQRIVEQINNKYLPEAGAVSERHDWIRENDPNLPLAGAVTSDAQLVQLEDGEWGVMVDTVLSKTNPRYEDVKTNIEQGIYPGFSIEYITKNHVPVQKEGKLFRMLTDIDMKGVGFANRRLIANPRAEIVDFGYKEFLEVGTPQEEKKEEVKEEQHDCTNEKETKGEYPMAEPKQEDIKEVEAKEFTVSAEDMKVLAEAKERQAKEMKLKEIAPLIKEAVDAELKEYKASQKPLINKETKIAEFKEFDSYKKALEQMSAVDSIIESKEYGAFQERDSRHKKAVKTQYKEAARLVDALSARGVPVMQNFLNKHSVDPSTSQHAYKEVGSNIEMKEFARIEMKGLENEGNAGANVDTNLAHASWTYGSYYLSPVELNDIFQPVVVNQLNDRTTTWGILQKEDWSGYSQVQFRARTGRNDSVGGYTEGTNWVYGTDFGGQVGRDKFQQPFAYYGVRVAVTGPAQRLSMSPGGMGDRWSNELEFSTADLLRNLNQAVIGTGAGSAENAALGFEILMQGTTGTLYGKNIATYTTLQSHQQAMSSARVDINQLRLMVERVQTGNGNVSSAADINDLVFICHHTQERFIKALLQDMQRLVPTSARAGFEGRVEVDGVPVFTDRLMNTDDIFLVDLRHTKIAMNLPPTIEPLPVTADAQAALVKTYWNLYSDMPGNNYWASGFATS